LPGTGLRGCGAAGLRDYGTAGLRDTPTAGLRDYGTTGLRDCGTAGLRDYVFSTFSVPNISYKIGPKYLVSSAGKK
jgi:hypothetical protein